MSILYRYIAREVLGAVVMVLLSFLGLFLVVGFISEIGAVDRMSYTLWDAFMYVLLRIPKNVELTLPMICLLGVLVGMGSLASRHELVVMQASGVSIRQTALPVMFVSLVFLLLSFVLSAYISPQLSHIAAVRKTMKERHQVFLVTNNALWLKDNNDFIFIGKRSPDGRLDDIIRYTIEDNQLKRVTVAKQAHYEHQLWHMSDVTQINLGKSHVTRVKYGDMKRDDLINPSLINVIVSDADDLTLTDLYAYIQYLKENNLNASQYELTFWRNFFRPITVFILMLFAVPFTFGVLRSSTFGLRVVIGVVLGFFFYTVDQFFGPLSLVTDLNPLLGASLPSLVFAFLLFVVMWRSR